LLTVVVDGVGVARIQERVPIRHVDQLLLNLLAGVLKLGEEAARAEVVLVLV
jgi:hypothetical protein